MDELITQGGVAEEIQPRQFVRSISSGRIHLVKNGDENFTSNSQLAPFCRWTKTEAFTRIELAELPADQSRWCKDCRKNAVKLASSIAFPSESELQTTCGIIQLASVRSR